MFDADRLALHRIEPRRTSLLASSNDGTSSFGRSRRLFKMQAGAKQTPPPPAAGAGAEAPGAKLQTPVEGPAAELHACFPTVDIAVIQEILRNRGNDPAFAAGDLLALTDPDYDAAQNHVRRRRVTLVQLLRRRSLRTCPRATRRWPDASPNRMNVYNTLQKDLGPRPITSRISHTRPGGSGQVRQVRRPPLRGPDRRRGQRLRQ